VGDTVQDGETGYLAPEEDLAMYTAKMIKLATEHEVRAVMSEKARQASCVLRHSTHQRNSILE